VKKRKSIGWANKGSIRKYYERGTYGRGGKKRGHSQVHLLKAGSIPENEKKERGGVESHRKLLSGGIPHYDRKRATWGGKRVDERFKRTGGIR